MLCHLRFKKLGGDVGFGFDFFMKSIYMDYWRIIFFLMISHFFEGMKSRLLKWLWYLFVKDVVGIEPRNSESNLGMKRKRKPNEFVKIVSFSLSNSNTTNLSRLLSFFTSIFIILKYRIAAVPILKFHRKSIAKFFVCDFIDVKRI